jgi:hypothetical protein
MIKIEIIVSDESGTQDAPNKDRSLNRFIINLEDIS